MTPERECRICGQGWIRDHHARWCAHVRAWLVSPPSLTTAEVRAKRAARQREYRRRKREAA